MKTLILTSIISLGIGVIAIAFINTWEENRCLALLKQSGDYADKGFYITSNEQIMCDAHNIFINAPIR